MKNIKKHVYLLLSIVVVAVVFVVYISQANNGYRRYQMESGIIEYSITGAQSGTGVVYFDRWGMREAKYASVEFFSPGGVRRSNTLTILDGDWIYNIDLDKKIGTKKKNVVLKEVLDEVDNEDPDAVGKGMMEKAGAEIVGQEKISKMTCDVWEIKQTGEKTWLWRWLPLKSQARVMGGVVVTAVKKIKEGARIPDEKFAVPPKIYFIDGDIDSILLSYNRDEKQKICFLRQDL